MSTLTKHSIASGLILVLCIIFFMETIDYPSEAARLPQILIILIALLAIGMFIEAFIKQKKINVSDEKVEEEKTNVKRVFIFGIIITLYIFLIDILGYFLLTPIFIFCSLIFLRATKLIPAIFISILIPIFIYVVFKLFLNIPIPMGLLG